MKPWKDRVDEVIHNLNQACKISTVPVYPSPGSGTCCCPFGALLAPGKPYSPSAYEINDELNIPIIWAQGFTRAFDNPLAMSWDTYYYDEYLTGARYGLYFRNRAISRSWE